MTAFLLLLPDPYLPATSGWFPRSLDLWIDKVGHLLVFLIMMLLWTRSLRRLDLVRRPILAAAMLTLAISFGLEVLQGLVPGRHAEIPDLVANALGVTLGLAVIARFGPSFE